VRYLVDSVWLIDAFLGVARAVNLLARLRGDGLAVSIVSYGELFEGAIGAPTPRLSSRAFAVSSLDSLCSRSTTPLWNALPGSAPSCAAEANSFLISIC
jgi:hypothetical protein